MPINLSYFLGELMYKIMCIKDKILMNGGEVVDKKVYPLPLFVESLRRSMGVTQQELSDQYDEELNKEISSFASQVDKQLHELSNERTKLGPKAKALFRAPSKRKIGLYVQLRDASDELKQSDYSISTTELKEYCEKLQNHINEVTMPDSAGIDTSNGGIEVRTIRAILNLCKEPHEEELSFILLNCFPQIMTKAKYANFTRRDLWRNKRNVVRCFFSYSKKGTGPRYILEDTSSINSIIEYIWSQKDNLLFADKRLSAEDQQKQKIHRFREVFKKITDMLMDVDLLPISSFSVPSEVFEQDTQQNQNEYLQIWLGERAKHDLEILLDTTQIHYAWNDISSVVYDITKQTIMMTDRQLEENPDKTENKNDLLISFFYYLLYSEQLIRDTIARYRNSGQQKE